MPPLENDENEEKIIAEGIWEEAKMEFKDVKFNMQNSFIAESI